MKKRLTILALMMALVMVLSLTLFVACNKAEEQPVEEKEETVTIDPTAGLVISNGDFKVIDTEKEEYPRSITGWTGSKTYSSGSYNTGLVSGAISLEEALYNANKSAWKDTDGAIYNLLKSHYSADEDAVNNVLMLYMPTKAEIEDSEKDDFGPTAYGYTSNSFKLEAAKYYKVSVDVLTYKIAGDPDNTSATPGARIYISSNAYGEFKQINTDGAWQTYTFFVEGNSAKETSLTINLGLGNASTYDKKNGLTTGYAFFDNLAVEEVAVADYQTAVSSEQSNEEYRANNQTFTCKVVNGNYNFGNTTVSSSAAPSGWSITLGNSSESDSAPSGSYINGIVDVNDFGTHLSSYPTYYIEGAEGTPESYNPKSELNEDMQNIVKTFGDNRIGTKVAMLSQRTMTAQGLKASNAITIEKGKCYAFSVSVYTFDVRGAGVTLELKGDGNPIYIKGISENKSDEESKNGLYIFDAAVNGTNGGWTTYTFYIKGNQYKDTSYTPTFWLGTGGTNDNTKVTYTHYSSTSSTGSESTTYTANGTFASGWAFFDEVKLEEISSDDFANALGGTAAQMMKDADKNGLSVSGAEAIKVSLATENLFDGVISYDMSAYADAAHAFDNGTLGTPNGFAFCEEDVNDETLPVINAQAGVVSVADGADFSTYGVANPGLPYVGAPEFAYMLNGKAAGASGTYCAVVSDDFNIKQNNYYRISMWIKTEGIKSTSGLYVYLLDDEDATKSSFTTINTSTYDEEKVETSKWTEYVFYIRGGNDEAANFHFKFTLGTGSRWTTATLADGAAFIANMSCTAITYSDYTDASTSSTAKTINLYKTSSNTFTNGNFDNIDYKETKGLDANGALKDEAGVPSNWTLNNKKYAPAGDEDATTDSSMTYTDDNNLVAGIIKLDVNGTDATRYTHSALTDTLFGAGTAGDFDALYDVTSGEYLDNYERIGAPNLLAIAGLNGNKYFRSFKSDSISLTAGTNYTISVYAKTIKAAKYSIYLTGATGATTYFGEQNNFVIDSPDNSEWTKYTFYIEVGLNSVSVNLVLGLGYDKEISGDSGDNTSSGIVLFDCVTLSSKLTDEEFDAIATQSTDNTYRKISFLTNGFDVDEGKTYTDNKPISPSGYTGAAEKNQSADNTSAGIALRDSSSNTYAVDADDAVNEYFKDLVNAGYVSVFGKTFNYEDYEILQTEIDEAKTTYVGKSDDEIKVILQKIKMYNDMKENYITVDELKKAVDNKNNDVSSIIGNSFLVINNKATSAYTYTSSSLTMSANKYYRVSVYVRTYNVTADSKGAGVELYLGSANKADAKQIFNGITGTTDWTQYTFFVKTLDKDVTSVTIKLSLGAYEEGNDTTLSSGYAMFDAIEIEIVDEATFADAQANIAADAEIAAVTKAYTVPASSEEGDTDPDDDPVEEPEKNKFDLQMLWWMIPTILLALATIAVVVVYAVRRFRKPKKETAAETAQGPSEAVEEKRSKYDDYNE